MASAGITAPCAGARSSRGLLVNYLCGALSATVTPVPRKNAPIARLRSLTRSSPACGCTYVGTRVSASSGR